MKLADLVWEAWDGGAIDDEQAALAWLLLATRASAPPPKADLGLLDY